MGPAASAVQRRLVKAGAARVLKEDGGREKLQRAHRRLGRFIWPVPFLEVAVGALRARPPAGVEVAYVEGFVGRNRGTLLGIVRGAFGGG